MVLCPGAPEGSTGTGSGFKASQKTGPQLTDWEKPGIEPATPGLHVQDIGKSPTPRRLKIIFFLWPCSLTVPVLAWLGLCFLWFYVQELPKAQPAVVLV